MLGFAGRTRCTNLDRSGSAAVEFALTAPVLTLLLLGICDIAPTLMAKFKVVSATQSVADLAALAATMQASDVANFFSAGSDVMAPFSGTNLQLRITNIASDGNNRLFVYWSCGQGLTPFAALSTVSSSPTGTPLSTLATLTSLGRNTSYVMVESSYSYTPPAGFFLRSAQTMTSVAYTLPRVSTYIGPTSGDPNYIPTVPTSAQWNIPISQGAVTCNIGV